MVSKKIFSIFLMCAFVFGCVGFAQSKMNVAYAMADVQVESNVWHVSGEKDLKKNRRLLYTRFTPQGWNAARRLIDTCISENRTLEVRVGDIHGETCFYYRIIN